VGALIAGVACVSSSAFARPIDGFAVAIGKYATSATYPTPTSTAGNVLLNEVGNDNVDDDPVDPFLLSPGLRGVSPYIAIEVGGSVTFSFPTPMRKLQILWGTIDSNNVISFYDKAGKLVGTLSGQGIQQSYGLNPNARSGFGYEASVRIISPKKFTTIVLTTGTPCFEFSNVFAQ
jgi:hypothetical protein